MTEKKVPQKVHDLMDTFHSRIGANVCPITGWENTITGTYETIAAAVNDQKGTEYTAVDIGWAKNWLAENGPDRFGVVLTKVGPGMHKQRLTATDGVQTDVFGNIYRLVLDGESTPDNQLLQDIRGDLNWAKQRVSTATNEIIDIGFRRSQIPTTSPKSRTLRAELLKMSTELANEVATLQRVIAAQAEYIKLLTPNSHG